MGPFQILEYIGQQAYKLELPPTMAQLHPVFHISLLEPYRARPGFQPPAVKELKEGNWEVEAIIAHQDHTRQPQYLIKWLSWPNKYNKWKYKAELKNCQQLLDKYHKRNTPALQPKHKQKASTAAKTQPALKQSRGRPKGSKNKTTLAVKTAAYIQGEA